MTSKISAAALLISCLSASAAVACDVGTGERAQQVFLDWNNKPVSNWVATKAVQSIKLPNGFTLGVKIEPRPTDLKLRTMFGPELVKITLFDLGGATPRQLTYTFGPSNSIQGYGAKGGADRVTELGDPGVRLTLLKPVCAAMRT